MRGVEHQHARGASGLGFVDQSQGQLTAVAGEQTHGQRHHAGLATGERLVDGEGVGAGLGVVHAGGLQAWRASLRIPALELRKLPRQLGVGVGVGDGLCKVVASDGLAVVSLEVQRHAARKAVAADERLHHPHHLGALLVDGGGVEVVDLHVAVRAHRVGHRACVFGELELAQLAHVLDALDCARGRLARAAGAGVGAARHVHAEFLIAENGQAFLQAELEPVAAGDAIAGPVVKVLVADDALDAGVVGVGGGGR